MIKNPAQQILNRKSGRWLPPLSLFAAALIMPALPAMAQVPVDRSEWLFPPVQGPCAPPLPSSAQCPYPSPEEIRFRDYVKKVIYRWMAERNLPLQDLDEVIKKYGRLDLISDIQAYVAADLLMLVEKPLESRTPDEQFVLNKFEGDFHGSEWALYDYAVKDGEHFVRDPCGWKPDAEVAAAYGLEYNGAPYCAQPGNIGTLFRFHIPGPKREYLYAAAFKAIFGGGDAVMASLMQDKVATHVSVLAGAATAGGIGGGLAAKNVLKIAPYLERAAYGVGDARHAARIARYTRFLGGGAFSIVTMMIDIGIEAIIAFAEEIQFQRDLDNLRGTRDRLAAGRQDTASAIVGNLGIEKAMLIMSRYGIRSSMEPLPRYRPGVDRVFMVNDGAGYKPAEFITLVDHGGNPWDVHMWKNWFVRTVTIDGQKIDSIVPELEVHDHEGIKWLATRVGTDRFRMMQVNAPDNATVCPTVNGLSTRRDRSCSIYYSDNIKIRLWTGPLSGPRNVTINLGVAPRIETSESFFFPGGTQTSHPIQVTGMPTPILRAGNMPPWLRLVNGSLVGNPGTPAGKSTIDLNVQTESGSDSKRITIYYGDPVQFMSPDAIDVTAIEPVQFTINTAGTPRPKITMTGWLPEFLSFRDNGDGTATVRGMWNGGITPFCIGSLEPSGNWPGCRTTITATNQAQTVQQTVTFRFHSQPVAVFQGPFDLKFVAGVEGRYLLTTSGARTPVEWLGGFGRLRDELRSLPWLQFNERSDGTAEVFGKPPMNGESSTTAFTVCPKARGSQFAVCGVIGSLKVIVDGAPRFMSAPFGTAKVGEPADIRLSVNRLNGDIGFSAFHTLTSQFPKGLKIEPAPPVNGMMTARISGLPEAGQGGRYEFMLNWTDQLSSVNSLFRLDVLEPARITGPTTFTFFEGTAAAAGEVTTQGYPVNSTGIDCGRWKDCADMSVRLGWGSRRIEGLTLTDRNPQGVPTGVGRFEGVIPNGASGVYEATIIASNGTMAPLARQPIRIVVRAAGDLNGDGKVDCLDLRSLKNAFGNISFVPGQGFDLTGDMVVDDKDIDAMVRAIKNLWACLI